MAGERRRSSDQPAADSAGWRMQMQLRLNRAEREAGVHLTPEWRAFFIALGNPDADEPDPGKLE